MEDLRRRRPPPGLAARLIGVAGERRMKSRSAPLPAPAFLILGWRADGDPSVQLLPPALPSPPTINYSSRLQCPFPPPASFPLFSAAPAGVAVPLGTDALVAGGRGGGAPAAPRSAHTAPCQPSRGDLHRQRAFFPLLLLVGSFWWLQGHCCGPPSHSAMSIIGVH